MKYLKYILLVIIIFLSLIASSQSRLKRGEDLHHNLHLYRVVQIPIKDIDGDITHFVSWMWDDLIPYRDQSYLLNLETQKDQSGIGSFISPTFDSLKLNYEGAMKSCPVGWKIPTIEDWDTLLNILDYQQKASFLNKNNGYKGFKVDTINGSINKSTIIINGSFYWTSSQFGEKAWGIEFDQIYNVNKGKADLADFLSVRCIKKEE
jgi:uncharacterized protein (TIGR02145 family)